MSTQPATRSSSRPLGTSSSLRRRLLFHHAPLALVSAVVLVVFMTLPLFDASGGPTVDMRSSSAFPQQRGGTEGMDEGDHAGDRTETMDMGGEHGGDRTQPMGMGGG